MTYIFTSLHPDMMLNLEKSNLVDQETGEPAYILDVVTTTSEVFYSLQEALEAIAARWPNVKLQYVI
jgi:hypothetical protein